MILWSLDKAALPYSLTFFQHVVEGSLISCQIPPNSLSYSSYTLISLANMMNNSWTSISLAAKFLIVIYEILFSITTNSMWVWVLHDSSRGCIISVKTPFSPRWRPGPDKGVYGLACPWEGSKLKCLFQLQCWGL